MSVHAALRASSRLRPSGLLLVMAVHVALVWLVANGLGLRLSLEPPTLPIQATFEEEIRPETAPPPFPPTPTVGPTRVIEPVEAEIALPPEDPAAGETISSAVVENSAGSALPEPHRVVVGPDPRHPLTQPPYPAASVRFGEEGTVTIELRVGTDGRVRESRLLRSSGFPRLDAAALAEALRAWRLKPASVDGTPVEAWHAVRVSFRLDRR
jgi:protein TonB